MITAIKDDTTQEEREDGIDWIIEVSSGLKQRLINKLEYQELDDETLFSLADDLCGFVLKKDDRLQADSVKNVIPIGTSDLAPVARLKAAYDDAICDSIKVRVAERDRPELRLRWRVEGSCIEEERCSDGALAFVYDCELQRTGVDG